MLANLARGFHETEGQYSRRSTNGNGSKSWLLLSSFLVAGTLGWVMGIKSDIDGYSRDIQGQKVKIDFLIDEIRELRAGFKKQR